MLSIQDKIQRAMAPVQRKLFDTEIEVTSTKATNSILLQISEDKYGNTKTRIDNYENISCTVDFPNNEIPLLWDNPSEETDQYDTDDNTATTGAMNNVLHFYELVPITGFFKFEDCLDGKIRKGNVILYKVKVMTNKYSVIPLQIIDRVAKSTLTDVTYIQYVLAPLTDGTILRNTTYQRVYNEFLEGENW
jgi:hypothetical protein